MDGLSLYASALELKALEGGRIDKIQQPENDELIIGVRSGGENHKLLISASASNGRVQLTGGKHVSPMEAPMFCMLLRKRIAGGRIAGVVQQNLDRVLYIAVSARNELGDEVVYRLYVELMGKYSNIILVNEKGAIIDSIKHVGVGMSNVRLVMPGLMYELPPQQDKRDPLSESAEGFYEVLLSAGRADKLLSAAYYGLSPAIAAELLALTTDKRAAAELSTGERESAAASLYAFYSGLSEGNYSPAILFDDAGTPSGVLPFLPSGVKYAKRDSMASALDEYYGGLDSRERMKRRSASVKRILQNNIERCEKKLALYDEALDGGEQMERDRLNAELITAGLHSIKPGATSALLMNYYLDPPAMVEVALDPTYSPAANAQRLYKRYRKARIARETAGQRRAETLEELMYLEGQLDNLTKCETDAELNEISEELGTLGYIKRQRGRVKERRQPPSKPMRFMSSDGIEIYVGKNNAQNDALTLRFASPDDVWLHVKDVPGSHVIVKSGGDAPKSTLYEAAMLAAYYSRSRGGESVAVDYTPRRYVKKPSGAKPGMVIYTTNKTAYVTPSEAELRHIFDSFGE